MPRWTEIGQSSGLDPLGMGRPAEAIYQSLLPGVSTITVRLRYYSFLPWVIDTYAKLYHSTDPQDFYRFQRRSEALFALAGVAGEHDTGLSGSNWATALLKRSKGKIDFAETAERTDGTGYLKNKGGALGGIYGPQLREMGLVETSKFHGLAIVTSNGEKLADAFRSSLGPILERFLDCVQKGTVSEADLTAFQKMRPSSIEPGSTEQNALSSILLASNSDSSSDDLKRRQTMVRILEWCKNAEATPTAKILRWDWLTLGWTNESEAEGVIDAWAVYQVSDSLRLSYETFLKRCLEVLSTAPDRSASLESITSKVLNSLESELLSQNFWHVESSPEEIKLASETLSLSDDKLAFVSQDALQAALKVMRATLAWGKERLELVSPFFPTSNSFQSLTSEIAYISRLHSIDCQSVLESIIKNRILKRHLWVASRKFRSQSAYTFLCEPDEWRLRYRDSFVVTPSNPRLVQAIQFLKDACLINEKCGLTDLGHKVLSTA